ncbi:hypothetical protein RJ640_028936 [Escallonia rubra]|uniref:Alliinase C-terminal domain-containing protein n=1 Tax=Escallonia rubra TaxID=112253 RepID=A0AA88R1H6_9ASTE|nr:hypothetical protein RJ640_028936 [Escallonia rubra]
MCYIEDRLIELETLQKALLEGTEAYDKLQADMVTAKANLTKILTSKDVKATVCAILYPHDPKSLKCSSRIYLECFQLKSLYLVMLLLDMVEQNELNRSLLALLDENISNANKGNQLRALKLLKVVLEGEGIEIFGFAHKTMSDRWEKLSEALSSSKRFSIQDLAPQYCSFFQRVRGPSPGDSSVTSDFCQ